MLTGNITSIHIGRWHIKFLITMPRRPFGFNYFSIGNHKLQTILNIILLYQTFYVKVIGHNCFIN